MFIIKTNDGNGIEQRKHMVKLEVGLRSNWIFSPLKDQKKRENPQNPCVKFSWSIVMRFNFVICFLVIIIDLAPCFIVWSLNNEQWELVMNTIVDCIVSEYYAMELKALIAANWKSFLWFKANEMAKWKSLYFSTFCQWSRCKKRRKCVFCAFW